MNLFERLLYRRLCNEQPVDGGAASAASEPSAPAGDTLLQLVIHHNRKVISHNLLLMAINLLMTKSLKTISRMKKGRR